MNVTFTKVIEVFDKKIDIDFEAGFIDWGQNDIELDYISFNSKGLTNRERGAVQREIDLANLDEDAWNALHDEEVNG